MIGSFHIRSTVKRRGGILPARLRFSARRGVTLVELMISMLILTIVCLSWFEILSIQSAKREALRREGVERLAGMMEAFIASFYLPAGAQDVIYSEDGGKKIGDFQENDAVLYNPEALSDGVGHMFERIRNDNARSKKIHPIFSETEIKDGRIGAASPGYRLHIGYLKSGNAAVMDYDKSLDGQSKPLMRRDSKILVGDLYERVGEIDEANPPKRICRLKLFMR